MSVQATDWAFAQRAGNPTAKAVLAALAHHADTSGVCWPGQALLAEECDCSDKTIGRHMGALERGGLIRRFERRRPNGSRTSDWVVLAPEAGDRGAMADAPLIEDAPEVSAAARRGNGWRPAPKQAPARSDQLTLDDLPERSPDILSGDISASGHPTIWGGPEPSEEPSAQQQEERARERAPHLDQVVEILGASRELTVDVEAVNDVLLASRAGDHVRAAYDVRAWARGRDLSSCRWRADGPLRSFLREQVGHQGRRRAGTPRSRLSGDRSGPGWRPRSAPELPAARRADDARATWSRLGPALRVELADRDELFDIWFDPLDPHDFDDEGRLVLVGPSYIAPVVNQRFARVLNRAARRAGLSETTVRVVASS